MISLYAVPSLSQIKTIEPPKSPISKQNKGSSSSKNGYSNPNSPLRPGSSVKPGGTLHVPPNNKTHPESHSERILHNQQWAVDNILNNMVYIEGGPMTMGITDSLAKDANYDNHPAHEICLSPYYIGKYEVTEEEWLLIMGTEPSDKSNGKEVSLSCPVDNVSWDDCQEFVSKLSQLTNKPFRLPTEAEWEFAAKGGKDSAFSFSGFDTIDECGWFKVNSTNVKHPVGEKSPNQLGLYDMTGNVREWCSDFYESNYYERSPILNPEGPTQGTHHVMRGGSFHNSVEECKVTYRAHTLPYNKNKFTGLRLVYSADSNP